MACLVPLLLLTAFYLIENWRGARAWKNAQARLAAAGESLDLKSLETPQIAPAENFCATPALDGMGGEGDAAEIKQRRLAELSLKPHSRSGIRSTQSLTREPLDWLAWRYQLEATKHLKPPAKESDPVRAVVRAFEPHAALFDELVHAARDRPHAQFQPLLLRITARSGFVILGSYSPSPFQVLTEAVELRARALLAAGDGEQAALLLPVLVCCRQSMASEPSRMVGLHVTLSVAEQISRVLLDGLRSLAWQEYHLEKWDRLLALCAFDQQVLPARRWEMADTVRFVDDLRLKPALAVAEWYGDSEYHNINGRMLHRRALLHVIPLG